MSDRLRIAVIGVGHLGRHHARILASMPEVELIGVVDIDEARASAIAAEHGVPAFTDARAVLDRVQAVSVAVPTEAHLEVALPFLEQGVSALVEKPLARTVAEADRLVEAARARGVVLAAGHTERFNPAVAVARPLIRDPRFIEVHRLGTFPERSLDIDVVFDLMIHDLDLVMSLVGDEVVSIDAVGVPVLTGRVDIANARLRFKGGAIANLTASRISRDRVRKIRFFQQAAYVSIDYAAQEVEVWRLVRADGGVPSIEGGKLEVPREEPLRRELEDFVAAVREGRPPAVPGEDGRAALALAAEIVEQMQHGQ
ncbi:MAG: Gfo/Idh/MocA family oxidoreductase [Vicinamibacterales bacterium]|nr:Gfo/Idh/MocA family oxidoreductase [Vicinamibacterales bacterium]